ncbi:MAG TPA: hypothetical protein VJ551_02000 [Nitrososphaeraceae archaeon]|nr:hypothetical protein [Nitrososphaeraceae archaeon]
MQVGIKMMRFFNLLWDVNYKEYTSRTRVNDNNEKKEKKNGK